MIGFSFILKAAGWLFRGPLSRVLDTIDNRSDNETDRQEARLEAIKSFAQTQAAMINGPGRWLLALFIVPTGAWYTSVVVYSMLFCAGCAFPQDWTIARLPEPLGEWGGWIVMSMFGYGAALAGAGMFKR